MTLICFAGAPSQPFGPLEPKNIRKDSLTLTWQPPKDDGGSPITGYVIEKRENSKGKWTPVDRVGKGITELDVKRLQEGQEYYFRVKAENKKGISEALETEASVVPKSLFGM
jgi:titin